MKSDNISTSKSMRDRTISYAYIGFNGKHDKTEPFSIDGW